MECRYSAQELSEFRELITKKMQAAIQETVFIKDSLNQLEESRDHAESESEGSWTDVEKEQLHGLLYRQQKFISELKSALQRIENKTYGICRVNGTLIPKGRLLAVPHTTTTLEAKNIKH